MLSFSSLNTPESVEFEDLRNPGIKTDVPRGFDSSFTETVGQFSIYREVDIVEIIRPELANLRYKIEVTTQVIGAIPVVNFGTLPSGVTLVSNANTYTISGIDTLAKWNAVKDPEIEINDFLGDFSYSVSIIYFNGTIDEEIRWTVGTYVPAALLPGVFTIISNAKKISNVSASLQSQSTLTATPAPNLFSMFTMSVSANKLFGTSANLQSAAQVTASGNAFLEILDFKSTITNPVSESSRYGWATAVSDTYSIVGAPRILISSTNSVEGKAFVRNFNTNTLLYTLSETTANSNTGFGYAVSITNNEAIVGAPGRINYSVDTGPGKVYVYNLSDGSLRYTLTGEQSFDNFGYSVAVDGNNLIVGAPGFNPGSNAGSGKVYVYNLDTGTAKFSILNPNNFGTSAGDNFGNSVAISSSYIAVGAYSEDDADGTGAGVVYQYNIAGTFIRTIVNPDTTSTSANDAFGYSISINNTNLVIGAPFENGSTGADTSEGRVYVYNSSTGALATTINNPAKTLGSLNTQNHRFGNSVSLEGTTILIGAPGHRIIDDVTLDTYNQGRAYQYRTSGVRVQTIENPASLSTDTKDFGSSVHIKNLNAIVGAPTTDSGVANRGVAYTYRKREE
jgi:hypothetical protein